MRIVADENIPGLDETFGKFGSLQRRKGRDINSEDVRDADVLLIRSVSRINERLLKDSSIQFVGSATIGIDHVDSDYLQRAGIRCCHAPACNADAAAQYTLAMILLAAKKSGRNLEAMTAGIFGGGNVGSRLRRLLPIVGIKKVITCDPPLTDAGQTGLVDMQQILECDVVCFHVPLTVNGPYPTHHLGNSSFFSKLKRGALVVNSARGAVLEATALRNWLNLGGGQVALDVWPEEPTIDAYLLNKITVATAHVAGYSLDGKLNGTRMLFDQFLEWQGIRQAEPLAHYPADPVTIDISSADTLPEVILAASLVEEDDQSLRECLRENGRISAVEFDSLRKNYRSRRDFAGIVPQNCPEHFREALKALGFAQSSH